MVKAVFENFEGLKKLHPAFASLQPQDMIKNGCRPAARGRGEVLQGKGLDVSPPFATSLASKPDVTRTAAVLRPLAVFLSTSVECGLSRRGRPAASPENKNTVS